MKYLTPWHKRDFGASEFLVEGLCLVSEVLQWLEVNSYLVA